MAKLTYEQKKHLKKSSFAIKPTKTTEGSYPIPDAAHARDALARVSQFGTPAEKAKVRSAVAKKFKSIAQTKGPQAKRTGK